MCLPLLLSTVRGSPHVLCLYTRLYAIHRVDRGEGNRVDGLCCYYYMIALNYFGVSYLCNKVDALVLMSLVSDVGHHLFDNFIK